MLYLAAQKIIPFLSGDQEVVPLGQRAAKTLPPGSDNLSRLDSPVTR